MRSDSVILIGGGGHAVVVAETARAAGLTVAGVYDDDPDCAAAHAPGAVPHLGPLADFPGAPAWIMCLGDLPTRAALLERLGSTGPATVAHPSAVLAPSAAIGPGVKNSHFHGPSRTRQPNGNFRSCC